MGLREWGVMALLGVLSAAYFTGVARAYQIAPPSIIATFDYAYLVSAALWGFVFFSETPDLFTLVGMILITHGRPPRRRTKIPCHPPPRRPPAHRLEAAVRKRFLMRYAKITDRLQGPRLRQMGCSHRGQAPPGRRPGSDHAVDRRARFAPPPALVGMIDERIRAGRTRYTNGRGEPEVLQAIAGYYGRRSGHQVEPEQVTFLPGTQTALFAAMMTVAEEG